MPWTGGPTWWRGGNTGPGAPTATPGNIQGAPGQAGAGPYGNIPQVPNPLQLSNQVYQGNLQNLGNLGQLGTGINTQIAQQAALPYQLNLPNYGAMTGKSSQNILSLLQGQVPQDVANQIAQMGAERGVATGSIGSPNSETALLRSLGLTSLGLQQQGESELTGAVARTPTGQQFNPASFLVSPQQQQEAQYLSNLYAAAPDPTQNALAQLQNSLLGYGFTNQRGYRQPSFQAPAGSPSSVAPVPAGAGFGRGGVPNPAQTGGTAYASSTPYTGMTQSDLDYLGLSDPVANPTSGQFYGGFNWMDTPYYGLGLGQSMAYPGDPNVYGGPAGQAPFYGGGWFGTDPTNPYANQYIQLPSGEWDTTRGLTTPGPYDMMGGGTPLAPQGDVTSTDWGGPPLAPQGDDWFGGG